MGMLNLNCFSNIEKSIKTNENMMSSITKRISLSNNDKKEIKELISYILDKKGVISKDGIVTCYYSLSKYNKRSFDKDGTVGAGSDKIMVSIKNTPDLKKYGDRILTLHIPIEKLYFVADTKDSVLLKIPFRSRQRKHNIKQYI